MQNAQARWETLNLIRQEKFDTILPIAMKENDIDMWIHVIREGNPDPLSVDLGGDKGYFVFSDKGEERVERAVFGGYDEDLEELNCYDIFGQESELREFVIKRNPKNIAVNYSDWIVVADGLSYTGYIKLTKLLGKEHSKRFISADMLITDFRTRRTSLEIKVYSEICEIARQLLERALSNEVIIPGETSLEDVGWWMEDQLISRGMNATFVRSMPMIIHSSKAEKSDCRSTKYVIQKGDLMQYDFGINHLNYGTDFKRVAYVLNNGETAVPPGIQNGWDRALQAREVIKKNIIIEQTAGKTLEQIGIALEKAGFRYVHLTTDPMLGGESIIKSGEEQEEDITEITIDCHCVGNTGNSEVASGPSIAGFRPDRAHLVIKPNNFFAFEFIAYTLNPDWGGKKVRFNMEDNAIVTSNGVEWLYPPNKNILLIR